MRLIDRFIGVIAPYECLGCGQECSLLCAECSAIMTPVGSRCYRCQTATDAFAPCPACKPTVLQAVYAVYPYEELAKELIHALKFERAAYAARDIAAAMVRHLPSLPPSILVTHVPTAHGRVRMRGYDQAQLIAKEFARLQGLRYAPLLARQSSVRQLGQNRAERQEQMKHAFYENANGTSKNRHILLVDDVITTGSTIDSAAAALQAAGAASVSAAVFAAA